MTLLSTSSGSGDIGRDAGADLSTGGARGSCVPHISHSWSDGWFKNVQAGQGISLGTGVGASEAGNETDAG